MPGFGHDQCEHVAEVGGASADGNEGGPVLVDQSAAQFAGHVGGGEHGDHAGHGQCRRRLDRNDVGPSVLAQDDSCVQAAVGLHVVDEVTVAEGECLALVLDASATDAAGGDRYRRLPRCE